MPVPSQLTFPPGPLAAAVAFTAVVAFVVALITGAVGLLAALVLVPLAEATFASPRATAGVGMLTLGVVFAGGALTGHWLAAPHVAAVLAVGLAGVLSVMLAVERRERERTERFAGFLGDAGTLLACSLDFDETAKAVSALPVPELADWCLVELTSPEGEIERRTASHPDEGAEYVAGALAQVTRGEPGRPRPELFRELPDALYTTFAGGDVERLEAMRMVGTRSAMRVPLRTPEGPLGSMLLIETGSRRRFDEQDLRRAEELAARCSLAIENARAYRAARRGGERRFGRRADLPSSSTTDPRPAD